MSPAGPPFVVFYPRAVYFDHLRDLARAVAWCLRQGVGALAAPTRVREAVLDEVGTLAHPLLTDASFDALRAPSCPVAIVVPPGGTIPRVGARPAVLFAPEDVSDPRRPDRLAVEVWNGPNDSLASFRAQRGL